MIEARRDGGLITRQPGVGDSIMAMVLKTIEDNVVAGIRDAQKAGIVCGMPKEIEVDLAVDCDGLPCTQFSSPAAARIKTVISLEGGE